MLYILSLVSRFLDAEKYLLLPMSNRMGEKKIRAGEQLQLRQMKPYTIFTARKSWQTNLNHTIFFSLMQTKERRWNLKSLYVFFS
jgi:hypothetical protein